MRLKKERKVALWYWAMALLMCFSTAFVFAQTNNTNTNNKHNQSNPPKSGTTSKPAPHGGTSGNSTGNTSHGNQGGTSGQHTGTGNQGGGTHGTPGSNGPASTGTAGNASHGNTGNAPRGGTGGPQPGNAGTHTTSGGTHTTSNGNPPYRPPTNNTNPNGPGPGSHGTVTRTVHTTSGNTIRYGNGGHVTSITTHTGTVARYGSNGHITSIHTRNTTIINGPHGGRTIVTVRNNTRIVSYGPGRGYVQRSFVRGGSPFIQRTFVVNGRMYSHVYAGFYWHGAMFYRFVPGYYFAPAFYGWAYHPWGVSIAFGWGWGPWYPYYGYYFAPYPLYASPVFWLTDFLLAADLEAAYDAQLAAANASAPPPPPEESSGEVELSPEVKQAIADEVSAQLAAQQNAAPTDNSGGAPATGAPSPSSDNQVPAALDPNNRTFIVSTALDERSSDGSACVLSPGDVLTRLTDTPDQNQNVNVVVTTSQNGDCRSGSQVLVSVQDLQDMANAFQQQMSDGLTKLAQTAGQNGVPTAPAPGQTPNADGQMSPDTQATADLQAQQQEANQNESEVNQAAAEGGGGN